MKRLLMLNIILLTLSLSACGGSDKDHSDMESGSQDQISVNQDTEDEDIENSSDESDDKDKEDTITDNNGNAASNPANPTIGADENAAIDTDADTEPDGFEVSTWVSSDRENGDYTRWFSDAESFLEAYGFDIDSDVPLLKYLVPDESFEVYLYYDPETHIGCGYQIWQENPDMPDYAFAFDNSQEETWDKDYYALVSVEGGSDGSWLDDYQTNIVYDDNGNLLQFESTGFVDWIGDEGITTTILSFTYEYDDNGTLRYREYHHSSYVFATSLSYLYTYFDELGRPVFEKGYITHGHLEYYYIYTGSEMTPTYRLCLDDNLGAKYPDFTIYTR